VLVARRIRERVQGRLQEAAADGVCPVGKAALELAHHDSVLGVAAHNITRRPDALLGVVCWHLSTDKGEALCLQGFEHQLGPRVGFRRAASLSILADLAVNQGAALEPGDCVLNFLFVVIPLLALADDGARLWVKARLQEISHTRQGLVGVDKTPVRL